LFFSIALGGLSIFFPTSTTTASLTTPVSTPPVQNPQPILPSISPVSFSTSIPTTLTIPKINVKNSVKAMGLTKDNKMAVPNNYTEVGWFGSALGTIPGNIGNAVLGAHVDNGGKNPTTKGVFKNLKNLIPGDDIYITDANGKELHFKVATTRVYTYDSKETLEIFGPTTSRNLNLITCYGKWLPKAGTYDKRLIVFAKLVS
jgi:sortase (surface protein transpeptidase)